MFTFGKPVLSYASTFAIFDNQEQRKLILSYEYGNQAMTLLSTLEKKNYLKYSDLCQNPTVCTPSTMRIEENTTYLKNFAKQQPCQTVILVIDFKSSVYLPL